MVQISSLNGLCSLHSILIVILLLTRISSSNTTLLKGKHLILLPTQFRNYMDVKVNSSGYVIQTNGSVPEMLDWLSTRLQFDLGYKPKSFSFVPSTISLLVDGTPTQRGKLDYLKNNEADMVIGVIVLSHQRFQKADFPMPWQYGSFGAVVPSPKPTLNAIALFLPLQIQVWIGVVLALPIFIFCIGGLSKSSKIVPNHKESGDISIDSIMKYTISVILSQGGYLRNSSFAIRLAAAGWCLACFVLIQSYSCTLTSFLAVSQYSKPIINSIYDIPKVKNLLVVTDRGLASDNLLSNADFGVFKQFGAMLKNNPELRCNSSELCMEKVKSGSRVYIGGAPLLDLAIQSDYLKNGDCRVILLKERFLSSLISFAIAKKSVYMEELNRGIVEMMEFGFVQYWDKKYVVPKKIVCHQEDNNNQRVSTATKSRLSLSNLTSPFALLFFGYMLSFLVFLCEKIVSCIRMRQT